jgi:hypothetical protein
VPDVHELAGGLWTWTGRHPDWHDDPHWGPDVRSYALRTDDGVILFDPIAPPEELTRDGSVEVVLTAEWHGRDAKKLGLPIRGDDLPPQVTAQPAFFSIKWTFHVGRSVRRLFRCDTPPRASADMDVGNSEAAQAAWGEAFRRGFQNRICRQACGREGIG